MIATLTLVVCLSSAPENCELKEVEVDALMCFYGSRNVAEEELPKGYKLQSVRCVPHFAWAQHDNAPTG
jgi:hypothetical protein